MAQQQINHTVDLSGADWNPGSLSVYQYLNLLERKGIVQGVDSNWTVHRSGKQLEQHEELQQGDKIIIKPPKKK